MQQNTFFKPFFLCVGIFLCNFIFPFYSLANTPAYIYGPWKSNITDCQFTVSWVSTVEQPGYVIYGQDPNHIVNRAYDDIEPGLADILHHVTISGLYPETTYYFDIVAGVSEETVHPNQGTHYSVTTGPSIIPVEKDLAQGYLDIQDNNVAMVYIFLKDADGKGDPGESAILSFIDRIDTSEQIFWLKQLANIRTRNHETFFDYSTTDDHIYINIITKDGCKSACFLTNNDSPVPAITIYPDTNAPITSTNPAGGAYSQPQNIALNTNEPAIIYYTLDGSIPDELSEATQIYTDQILISENTTIKFFSKDIVGNYEDIKTSKYVIGSCKGADINNDNIVDIQDLIMIAICFGLKEGDVGYNPLCDINGSGCIDMPDLIAVARCFGKKFP